MELTKRAVLYVGYICNANCKFCYYHHMKNKKWKNLALAKLEALVYRKIFGNDQVDITGGEPTIYPYILELVSFCKKIGLRPTIITNGLALADEKNVSNLKKAGIFDFLISIHGLGENYDKIVGLQNAAKIQEKSINNVNKYNIPIRINVTLTKMNLAQLSDIANYAVKINAKVVNFISFNPFCEWAGFRSIDFQERHSIIASYLIKAIKILDKNKIESNIRYFPFCIMKGFEEHQYNFSQVPYDPHEWDFMSWFKNKRFILPFLFNRLLKKETPSGYYPKQVPLITRKLNYKRSAKCEKCSLVGICDGPTEQYLNSFGDSEFSPYCSEIIKEPTFFIKKQLKVRDK